MGGLAYGTPWKTWTSWPRTCSERPRIGPVLVWTTSRSICARTVAGSTKTSTTRVARFNRNNPNISTRCCTLCCLPNDIVHLLYWNYSLTTPLALSQVIFMGTPSSIHLSAVSQASLDKSVATTRGLKL